MLVTEVRPVPPDDWSLWRDVRLRALADAPEAFGQTLADWEAADEPRWRRRLRDVPCNLVAVRDGAPVGQASGTAVDGRGRAELISMWVAPEARGTGAAAALVDGVAGWARSAGAAGLQLAVRRANERAIRLYRALGFVEVDEPARPGELAMLRALTP